MTTKKLLTLFMMVLPLAGIAQRTATTRVEGYAYGEMATPTGWEWQSPDSVAYNKEQPRAWFFSFKDEAQAREVLPEHSSYVASLNGKWKFRWVPSPELRTKDFFKRSFDVSKWKEIEVPANWNVAGAEGGKWMYGKPIYTNQRVIFAHHVRVGDWKGGVMRIAPENWLVHDYPNEVGQYKRSFMVPKDWKKREVYINFDGVDSFFYLWVNGKYVGFSKNSRNLARFDVSPFLRKGKNEVAVEVYRNSDGSFLESQDMFRLPGIFRDVYLTASPKVQVRDLVVIPKLKGRFNRKGELEITTSIANLTQRPMQRLKVDYRLYKVKLYGDATEPTKIEGVMDLSHLGAKSERKVRFTMPCVEQIVPWSAERPQRYVLVGQLKDAKGKVIETFSTYVGFRQIEIRYTSAADDEFGKAGRYYYLNGQPIKMKGVNRHENSPQTGHYVTRDQMKHEIDLMKRANINHVRNSHYPDAPYWYVLCDKYGIYLEDEANIESHEYYYGKESLSHVKEMKNAHVARQLEMVHATVNHPSVVLWSLGNEAGPGQTFVEGYKAIKAFDRSRPVQYERNNSIVDIGSNQYPSVAWVQSAAKGELKIKYPFHISEYAHSMGNAVGDLAHYWKAIESSNFVMGGAIWDWVDQAIDAYDPATQQPYWGYGGDFGDIPNDGMFCMNGIMRPDLTPKAQYYEVKKVYQNVDVRLEDLEAGAISIFNKNYFEPLVGYDIRATLWRNGRQVGEPCGLIGPRMLLGPRHKLIYRVLSLAQKMQEPGEYFLKVQFVQAEDQPWAKKGYVQMEEQVFLKNTLQLPAVSAVQAGKEMVRANIVKTDRGDALQVKGKGFTVSFNVKTGIIQDLIYGSKQMIADGNGPRLDAFRAPVDNDVRVEGKWFADGLNALQQKATGCHIETQENGALLINFSVEVQAPYAFVNRYSNRDRLPESVYKAERKNKNEVFGEDDFRFFANIIYTVYPDGSIALNSAVSSNKPQTELARIGYAFALPKNFNRWTYYGRGPVNNYNDRYTSQFIEQHSQALDKSYILLPKPQAMGNREAVRWTAMTDAAGDGLLMRADTTFSCSALPWSQDQIMGAAHIFQLPKSDATYMHVDAKVRGLGGASCGPGPLNKDKVKAIPYTQVGFLIRPVTMNNAETQAAIINDALSPISITVSRLGRLALQSSRKGAEIKLRIDNGAPQTYTSPIEFRQGGEVEAFYADQPKITFKRKFAATENAPLLVNYVSSNEPGEGDAQHLVDGDRSTYWHTQYGVTLAKYPHWVDFDLGEPKAIKGFVCVPRQDSSNGRIKEYAVSVSNDGENWTLVQKGTFPNSRKAQRVDFKQNFKARYLQFKALSEQNGNDYATAAEFEVLVAH